MARLGVDCELLTFGRRAGQHEDDSGLRIRVIEPWTRLGGHPAHPIAPAMLPALRHADVIHAHHLRAAPSRAAALAAAARRRPFVVTDHGLAGGDWWGLLPRLVDRLLAVSASSATQLAVPPERTSVVYGGADPERFTPGPDDDRDGVLYVGRVTPHKGLDRLIRALPPDATLTIAGSDGHDPEPPEREYPSHLRALAVGRDVRFVDRVDDEELPELYRRAAVVALPSVHVTCYGRPIPTPELLGLSVLEAMASGTPVVASRVGGVPEIVDDGGTGLLVEPGDVAGLRAAVATLLADPAQARAMGRCARRRVLERFTWDACARRCVAAYDELTADRAA